MTDVRYGDAQIAMDIVERSPSVALRVDGANGAWNTLFITGNVCEYGYSRDDFLSGRVSWRDLVHPGDLEALCEKLDSYEARGVDRYSTVYRIVKKDGAAVWVRDASTVTRDEAGRVLYSDCIISDYTEVMESQAAARDNLEQQKVLNDILQGLHAGKPGDAFQVILDRTGSYMGISRVVLFEDDANHKGGRAVYEWDNQSIPAVMAGGNFHLDYQRDIPEVAAALAESGRYVADYGGVPAGSAAEFEREKVIAAAVFAVHDSSGERYGFICFDECKKHRRWGEGTLAFLQNVSKLVSTALMRKTSEESIQRMAYHDQLTGLVNRYRFDMYMEQAITLAENAGRHGFVMFIDMDDFKIINDGYGHDYGDALLVAVADYMLKQYGDAARLFRFGGDEFTILVDWQNAEKAQAIIDDLLIRARHPWKVMDREFYCTISIGVVRFPDGFTTATDIIKNGDIAMYQAKNRGKNNYVIYNENLSDDSRQRVETEHKMRDAIEREFAGFRVHYQPIVDITGQITGAEALVRWADAEGKLMPPDEFIPLAEYLGLIVPLGEFVLREAAAVCAEINREYPRFTMSVNVSIRQFQQHDFLQRVEDILRSSRVDFGNIVLEVTEGMLIQDLEHMQLMVEQLRGMGINIAMDDFGTGYSSLSNMRQLPLDIIKIDRAFIRDITSDAYSKSFVRLITDLGHSMGRVVCVEGVETAAQYRYCAECRVDTIQGYYFYRPMPKKEFEKLVLAGLERAQ